MNAAPDPRSPLDFASIVDAKTFGAQLTALSEQRRDENGVPGRGEALSPRQLGALTSQSPPRIKEWMSGSLLPPDEFALQPLLLALGATAGEQREFFAALAPLWKGQQRVGPPTRRGRIQVPNRSNSGSRQSPTSGSPAAGLEAYLIAVTAGLSASFFKALATKSAEDAYDLLKKSLRTVARGPLARRRQRRVLLHFTDYDLTLDMPRDFELPSVEKLMEIPTTELRGATYRWDAKTGMWRKD